MISNQATAAVKFNVHSLLVTDLKYTCTAVEVSGSKPYTLRDSTPGQLRVWLYKQTSAGQCALSEGPVKEPNMKISLLLATYCTVAFSGLIYV